MNKEERMFKLEATMTPEELYLFVTSIGESGENAY